MSNDAKQPRSTDIPAQQDLAAGGFSSWLRRIRSAQGKGNGIDVPCGDCNACCRSSYFIHIRPEETRTLARIPKKLLFAAPLLPKGNVLLGYDEKGCCPMLIDDQCSIYAHRPLTCRSYDCRIFPAAGIDAGDDDKALIAKRIGRWKFGYPIRGDRLRHAAVQAAALFLREHAACFPAGVVPRNPTQLAILAIKVYRVFLKYDEESRQAGRVSAPEIVQAVMAANEKLEIKMGSIPQFILK